jgi:phosphoribosylanthranilate isomerase
MKLKICGMRDAANIKAVGKLMPDYMGFIFYPESPRFAGEVLDKQALLALPSNVKKVGVFVNPSRMEVIRMMARYQLDCIQLHGEESPEFCESIRIYGTIIKAFGVDENFDFEITKEYNKVCSHFLFDTRTVVPGGSGTRFDWKLLFNYQGRKPFFLSGGIGTQNAKSFPDMRKRFKYLAGVDVNSHFEKEPGIKDVAKLNKLVKILKKQNNELSGQ